MSTPAGTLRCALRAEDAINTAMDGLSPASRAIVVDWFVEHFLDIATKGLQEPTPECAGAEKKRPAPDDGAEVLGAGEPSLRNPERSANAPGLGLAGDSGTRDT